MKLPEADWLRGFCATNRVVLGSSSESRRKVLNDTGCHIHSFVSPDIDEKSIRAVDPHELTLKIAEAKAEAIKCKIPQHIRCVIITSDQVAVCEGQIREKPANREVAEEYISSYSREGKEVSTVTAVVVCFFPGGPVLRDTHTATVKFSPIPDDVIQRILDDKMIYTCAGGFAVDHPLMGSYVQSINGGIDSVMGMPISLLSDLCYRGSFISLSF